MNMTTDYAIRTLVYLAECKELVTAKDISINTGVSEHYLMKVIEPLKRNKIVKTVKGTRGGFLLDFPPEKITIWRIIRELEGPSHCINCMEKNEYCSIYENPYKCKLRSYMEDFQKMKIEYFSCITIADLQRKEKNISKVS